MKKKLAVLLSAIMTLGSVTVAHAAVVFSDIKDVPWSGAETYINGAVEAGLMVGDTDKNGNKVFRARDKVTYCETMQLAYSILKQSGNLGDTAGNVSKWQAIMNGYNIPTWAHEPVAYGLQNNILSVSDVSRFMAKAGTNNYAKREDVAVIFGKSLYVRTNYNVSSNPTLSFADKDKIASSSTPYVELLVSLDIFVGDNNNNFNPRNDINRAEMAVVALKTNNKLSGGSSSTTGDSVRGIISKINTVGNQFMLTLETASGSRSFLGTSSTSCAMEDGGSVSFADLVQGDVITVSYSGTDITSIKVHDKVPVTTVSGTIDQMTSSRIYILDERSVGYDLDNNVTITLNGDAATVKELMEEVGYYDVEATITVNNNDYVTRIVAKTTDSEGTKGTLRDITSSSVELKRSSNTVTTYSLASKVVYKLDGSSSDRSEIRDALDHYTVTATLHFNDDGEVNRLEASTTDGDSDGIISSNISSTSFSMKKDGKTKTYYLASGATFRLDGSSSSRSALNTAIDRYGSISATLTINNDDEVTRITASTSTGDLKGTISKTITTSSLSIKLSGSSKTTDYVVHSSCKYTIDGDTSSRREVNDLIDDDGSVTVSLTLDSSDRVTKIAVNSSDTTVKGTVEEETTEKYIRVYKDGSSSDTRYTLTDDTVYKLDGSSSSRSELNRAIRNNSEVYVTLELDGKYVDRVIASTDESSSKSERIQDLTWSKIKIDGSSYTLQDEDIDVYLDGSSTTLERLLEFFDYGDEFDATVRTNSNGRVTRITAYTRSTKGDYVAIYTDNMTIKIKKDGTNATYDIKDTSSNSCVYYIDGEQSGNEEDFYDEINRSKRDYTVELAMDSNGRVTRIDAERW